MSRKAGQTSSVAVRNHRRRSAWRRAAAQIRRLLRNMSGSFNRRGASRQLRANAPAALQGHTARVDLARLRLRAGSLEIPFTPADILNPEECDPAAEAVVVIQGGHLRGIVFGRWRSLGLADVLRLAARAGRLRRVRKTPEGQAEIWVDPASGVYDLAELEVFRLPAACFLGPAPCAANCGVA